MAGVKSMGIEHFIMWWSPHLPLCSTKIAATDGIPCILVNVVVFVYRQRTIVFMSVLSMVDSVQLQNYRLDISLGIKVQC